MKHPRISLLVSSFALVISGGLILSAPKAHATELLPPLVNTASAKEESPRQDKNQDVLTVDERRVILQEIISSSQDEINSLKDALNGLKLDDTWSIARDHFLDTLATSSDYYKNIGERLDQNDISLEDIKAIAKELKEWRESTYAPKLKEIGNLILISQVENVHTIVQERDAKISNDIKKLDRQKLVNTDALKKYLSSAERSIRSAQLANDKAKDLYFTISVAPLQHKKPTATSTEQLPEELISSPEAVSPATPSISKNDIQDEIRDLAKGSIKELKTAYELFFKMNDRIRK